jgi:hypothetical protein
MFSKLVVIPEKCNKKYNEKESVYVAQLMKAYNS